MLLYSSITIKKVTKILPKHQIEGAANYWIVLNFYYASIKSLSLRRAFSVCFFDIGSAISWCDTMIEQHYFRRKWWEDGRKEHKVETR